MPEEIKVADIHELIGGVILNAFMDSSKTLMFLTVLKGSQQTTYEIYLKRRDE